MKKAGECIHEVEQIIKTARSPLFAAQKIVGLRLQDIPMSYSLKEYAHFKGVSYRSVQRWISRGNIKVIRDGSHPRILMT